jgi:F-type H+-transporting ATPase subunit delta
MSERVEAARLARELFEVTWRHQQAQTVADELDAIAAAARERPGYAQPLFHPMVPQQKKLATVDAFVASLGLSKPTDVLLHALAHGYRLHMLPDIAASFRDRLNRKLGVIDARVTTAAPLPADKAAALAARLQEITGRQIQLETRVDPSIIGGVVTQVESTVYDGSVTRQLARMRQRLVENV